MDPQFGRAETHPIGMPHQYALQPDLMKSSKRKISVSITEYKRKGHRLAFGEKCSPEIVIRVDIPFWERAVNSAHKDGFFAAPSTDPFLDLLCGFHKPEGIPTKI